MKFFGFLSLLFVLGIGSWLLTHQAEAPVDIGNNTQSETAADNPLTAARDAADMLSGGGVEIYNGITFSRNTHELSLAGRELEGSLKAEVRLLSQLEVLDLSDNNFTGLPAEVGQLSRLRVLNLSNNPLTGLPYELGNLQQLETLDLRGTNYAAADLAIIEAALPDSTVILK